MELGLRFLAGLVFLLFLITEPIFRFYAWLQRKPRKRLPSLDPILKQSVTKVSAQIITKQVSRNFHIIICLYVNSYWMEVFSS